jgi:anti-sigma regulatory factor (Ser/Thr protein kinase)
MKPVIYYQKQFFSDLDQVDRQVGILLQYLDETLPEYNRFALDLVLRETLNNAVIHGNDQHHGRMVEFVLKLKAGQFTVTVTDEGNGFDWRYHARKETVQDDDHGRGFPIMRMYCTSFDHNEKGNQVVFTLPEVSPADKTA